MVVLHGIKYTSEEWKAFIKDGGKELFYKALLQCQERLAELTFDLYVSGKGRVFEELRNDNYWLGQTEYELKPEDLETYRLRFHNNLRVAEQFLGNANTNFLARGLAFDID